MESSSKGSSKRKPAFTMKVKLSKKRSSDSEDGYNSDDNFKPIKKKKSRADNSDIDSIPDLPEGTVVVKPEAVKEKKPRFSGPEFSKAPENLDIVNCTSCGRQINPNISGSAKRHPDLKVLVCRKCNSYYRSGKIEQDEDGLDEQCRWCGEGGRLSGCDFCHNTFCKSCIIRNLGRGEYSKVTADDGPKWKCYVCDPSKLKKLAKECTVLLEKVEREKMKAKMQGSKDGRTSSAKSQKTAGKSSGSKDSMSGRLFNKDLVSIPNISISVSSVLETVSELYTLTSSFQTMLEVLKVDLETCSDVHDSNREVTTKLDRGARTLQKSLHSFLTSVNGLLHQPEKVKAKPSMENGENTGDEDEVSNGNISISDDNSSVDITSKTVDTPSAKKFGFAKVSAKSMKSHEEKRLKTHSFVEECDVEQDNEDDSEMDLQVSFGPQVKSVEPKEETHKTESEKEASNVDPKLEASEEETDVDKNNSGVGDVENEEAQLELLQELAEEMCKEQTERKTVEKRKKEDPGSGDDVKSMSSSADSDSSLVSSSDVLLSNSDVDFFDDDFKASRKKTSTESGRKKRRKVPLGSAEKAKRKARKKQLRKLKKERKRRERKEKSSETKTKKMKIESDDELEKEITNLEKEIKMGKVKSTSVKDEEASKSESLPKQEKPEGEENVSGKEVKIDPSSVKEGKAKKKKVDSSSDDDNEDDQMDDFDEDEDKPPKLQNGKVEPEPIENGEELENEIAKNDLMAELNDDENDEDNDDESDTDEDVKKRKKKGKPAKKSSEDKENGENSDDEKESMRGKRKRLRGKLLDAKVSDSDSDVNVKKPKKKKVATEDSDSEEIGRRKLRKKKSSEKDESDDESDDGKKKRGRKKKGKKKSSEEEESDDESDDGKKKRGRKKKGKGKKKTKKKSRNGSDSFEQSSSSSEDNDSEVSLDTSEEERREKLRAERKAKRKAKGKRRRIKEQDDSSDEDKKKPIEDSSEYDTKSENDGGEDEQSPDKSGRKNIRKIKSNKALTEVTKRARKAEEARRKRVAERQEQFNHIVQETDEVTKIPVTTQLVLEFDKESKEPVIQVDKKLIRKLKPHQVEAVQFIWDCVCESVDRLQRKGGSGCILAHCMGLGKTLSVVTFIHTMLKNPKLSKMKTCLVVCPLNTVINWTNECDMWFDEGDKIDIYEMSSIKQNWTRADYLKDWHKGGGIMIIGYEMYRNLTLSARVKNKRQKTIFQETLVDPGPDLVVCDEGHILKNDSSAISQAMNKVRTRRRIVLTGTPLQNNLVEYHCMANFVKPDLLGTRKEFCNRFVNPIINGQHSDSTSYDVKVMTRRAHVLHEMLHGCVQRRNYSALTKFLPPKFEYVMSIRLMPKQIELYEKYLALSGNGANMPVTRGARLFSDYQNLMKIWTHPWVLKLSEIRAESKMKYDDSEDSFLDNSSASESEEESMSDSNDSEKAKSNVSDESEEAGTSTGRTRRTRRGKPPPGGDSDKEEIVKDWKTRSRGGEGEDDLMEIDEGPRAVSSEWWAEFVKEEDESKLELSGKLTLLFEILRMCEEIGDKVLIFSQSLLSLDIIEDFLDQIDRKAQEEADKKTENGVEEKKEGDKDEKKGDKDEKKEGDEDEKKKDEDEKKKDEDEKKKDEDELVQTEFGKSWTKCADYFRMDGSTSPQLRSQWSDIFNDPENFRARLFLISTKAGSLGINLVAANRVIIFDASWNPSHDIQSIFRVYRFGQTKPCYVYRFLAQGTMEDKIYERQVTKQSLSQRVVDEHQIDRHFTQADLTELYNFTPDRLDDPNRKPVVHSLPKDVLLAELLKSREDCIVKFHEHDSLLENREDQTLSEEEKKAAWEEYENDRKGVSNRVAQASTASGVGMFSPDNVLQIVQMVKMRFPNLPPDLFQAQVQAILQQQIMYQQSLQKQQIEQQRMMEMQRLHQIQQDIRSQQQQISHMNRGNVVMPHSRQQMRPSGQSGVVSLLTNANSPLRSMLQGAGGNDSRSSAPKKPTQVIDLS